MKMRILWCRTDLCSWKFSAKVSLTSGNPFPVTSLCKLTHISVSFIQISTKITCKQFIPFREIHIFFEVIPGVFGRPVNFNITLKRPVFPDYPFLVTMHKLIVRSSHQKCSAKKLFLKISQISQENTCVIFL